MAAVAAQVMRKFLFIILFLLILFSGYHLNFSGKIYPGISVAGIPLGGKTEEEAARLLQNLKPSQKIMLTTGNQNFEVLTSTFDFSLNIRGSVEAAFNLDRTGNLFSDFSSRALAPFKKRELGARINLDEEKLAKQISIIAGQVTVDPIFPSAKISAKEVVIDKGKPGTDLDRVALRIAIGQLLTFNKNAEIPLPIVSINPALSDEEGQIFKVRSENLLGKNLVLKFEFQTFAYAGDNLFSFLNAKGGYQNAEILTETARLAQLLNRQPENPVFVFENGRVKEFAAAKDGVQVDAASLKNRIIGNLQTLESTDQKTTTIDIPVERTAPEIKTGDVNNLGIKELIGRGTSTFFHSIPSRVHNVSLASSKFNGVLVKPGDTFSFNQSLGDVSAYTGFQQAYIIKEGKTVLGDGGGVCQVSTTLFRALLNAGLPITERAAHAYRVAYYEQDSAPGFDATVYSPSPDLKFKNDTPGYILIQTHFDAKNYSLVFELYGTADGRVAAIGKPTLAKILPAPEPLYQDDPNLPVGVTKQVDFAASGATATFKYTVSRDGEIIFDKTFISNYRPWQAVYLRGTKPAQ